MKVQQELKFRSMETTYDVQRDLRTAVVTLSTEPGQEGVAMSATVEMDLPRAERLRFKGSTTVVVEIPDLVDEEPVKVSEPAPPAPSEPAPPSEELPAPPADQN